MEGPVGESQAYATAPVEAADVSGSFDDDEAFLDSFLNQAEEGEAHTDANTEARTAVGVERQPSSNEREKVMQELIDYYGDQLFEYKSYKGTIAQIIAMCPAVRYFLNQGFEAVVAWADPYKIVEEKEEDDKAADKKDDEEEEGCKTSSHNKDDNDKDEEKENLHTGKREESTTAVSARDWSMDLSATESRDKSRSSQRDTSERKAKSETRDGTKSATEAGRESAIETVTPASSEAMDEREAEIHFPVEGAEAVFYSRARDDERLEDVAVPIDISVDTPDLTAILASDIAASESGRIEEAKGTAEVNRPIEAVKDGEVLRAIEAIEIAETADGDEVTERAEVATPVKAVEFTDTVRFGDIIEDSEKEGVVDETFTGVDGREGVELSEIADNDEALAVSEAAFRNEALLPVFEMTPETRMIGVLEHDAIKELVAEEAPLEVLFETIITELETHMKSEDDEPAITEYEALVGAVAAVRESVDRLFNAKTKEECREHLEQIVIELSVMLRALGYDTPERVAQAYIYSHSPQDIRFLIDRLERALRAMIANEVSSAQQTVPQHHRDARVGKVTAYIMQIISRHGASQELEYAA